jgi:hypothetical protein
MNVSDFFDQMFQSCEVEIEMLLIYGGSPVATVILDTALMSRTLRFDDSILAISILTCHDTGDTRG